MNMLKSLLNFTVAILFSEGGFIDLGGAATAIGAGLGFMAGGSAGSAVGAGIGSSMDQKRATDIANQQNKDLMNKNLAFQERMSSTAYQRQMKDMYEAGLNPMLASMTSGASTPGGAQATMNPAYTDTANAVSAALEAKRLKKDIQLANQEIKNRKAIERKTNTENTLLKAQEPKARILNKAGNAVEKALDTFTNSAKQRYNKINKIQPQNGRQTESQALQQAKKSNNKSNLPFMNTFMNWFKGN